MLSNYFYYALPRYLQSDVKHLDEQAIFIIMHAESYNNFSYSNTLSVLGIPSLKDHHEHLCEKLFESVVSDDRIHNLLLDRNKLSCNLRREGFLTFL